MGSVAVVTVLMGACIIAQVRALAYEQERMRGKIACPVTIP
jgi:hypothetical protein